MLYQIKFGTDGWRSVIADGFTYTNVQRVTQSTCHVLKKISKSKLILVGYDHRFLSNEFAKTVAEVALGNGYKVEVSSGPITSPTLSFNVKSRKAAIGVMITASHNPAVFNGFKLKGPHGGSANQELTNQVENCVDINPPAIKSEGGKESDFVSSYVAWLKKMSPPKMIQQLKHDVIFDSMHGPGGKIFEDVLGQAKKVHVIRKEAHPLFGGVNPEPIEVNLGILKEMVLRKKALVGIAVDGDGDRIGLVDNKGHYIPPHTVMPLILKHLIESRKLKGKVVQTVSMGYLPGRIAQKFKLAFEEVPVGFKHIAQRISEEKVLMGGEESGGFGVGIWSPERDGLLCALLILEILAKEKKPLSDIIEDLYKTYGVSNFKRVDFQLKSAIDKEKWTQNIQSHIGEKISQNPVKRVDVQDGIKVVLEDDSWVLMRPSGTEPLIRTYSEGTSMKIVKDLLTEAERLVHLPPPKPPRSKGKAKGERKRTRRISL